MSAIYILWLREMKRYVRSRSQILASLGLLPAAMSHAIGSETQRPIAAVVVGGTISAALLTLFVLPVTYLGGVRLREAWERWRAERARVGAGGAIRGAAA